MNLLRSFSFMLVTALAGAAQAHFVWATLTPDRTTLRLQFAESPGDSVLPSFAGKAATTKAFMGPDQPLKLTVDEDDRYLSAKLPSPRGVAGADLVYGVMDRSDQKRGVFLLHYFAKAAVDLPSASQAVGTPVEVFLKGSTVQVLRRGRPAEGAEIVVLPTAGKEIELKSDASGNATVPNGTTVAAVRAMVPETMAGTWGGKKYGLVRNYATLSVGAGRASAKADPEAYKALETAVVARQNFPVDVRQVAGQVTMEKEGRTAKGSFKYALGSQMEFSVPGVPTETSQALQDQVGSILGHRSGGRFADGDGKYPLSFSGKDDAIGRQITLQDSMRSSYRVKGDTITEVDRTIGNDRFVVTVLEDTRTPEGKTLPHVIVVTHFDAKTGTVMKADYITDEYQEVHGVWLPLSRQTITAENGRFVTTTLRFEGWTVQR